MLSQAPCRIPCEYAGASPFQESWPSSIPRKPSETGKMANDGELGQLFLNRVAMLSTLSALDQLRDAGPDLGGVDVE
jgi:hypothetical protein